MTILRVAVAAVATAILATSCNPASINLRAGKTIDNVLDAGEVGDFILSGEALLDEGATAELKLYSDDGYTVIFHNGPIDGTRKTGSLASVRNLYKSLAADGEWFPFEVAVRGQNIGVKINGTDVVCYTEPAEPYRIDEHRNMLIGSGPLALKGVEGRASFRNLKLEIPGSAALNPADTLPAIDEQHDHIIRLQQEDYPVIDWHIHCKGGLSFEMAHAMSMNYGINYGVGPNAYGPMKPGEGGYGTMYTGDDDLGQYYESVKALPFLLGVQGEGRKWSYSFSDESLSKFDHLYTDAMTVFDHKGRLTRTYRQEEVIMDIPKEEYMDMLVDQMVKILSTEPADFFANAFYIPDVLSGENYCTFDQYWTDERVDKVLDVMEANPIALEISARYLIPSKRIIQKAKDRGLKFVFGTNNMGLGYGKLEYSVEMARECGITPADLWWPVMSTRSARVEALKKN